MVCQRASFHQIRIVLSNREESNENAIQYSQENGQITISYAIENQQLRLSVQDTGIGISQKTKNGSLNGSIVSIKHVAVILVAPVWSSYCPKLHRIIRR